MLFVVLLAVCCCCCSTSSVLLLLFNQQCVVVVAARRGPAEGDAGDQLVLCAVSTARLRPVFEPRQGPQWHAQQGRTGQVTTVHLALDITN